MKTVQNICICLSLLLMGYFLGRQNTSNQKEHQTVSISREKEASSSNKQSPKARKHTNNTLSKKRPYNSQDYLERMKELIELKDINYSPDYFSESLLILDLIRKIPTHELAQTIIEIHEHKDFPCKDIVLEIMASRLGEEDGLGGFETLKNTPIQEDRNTLKSFFKSWAKRNPSDVFEYYTKKDVHKTLIKHWDQSFSLIMDEKTELGLEFTLQELSRIKNPQIKQKFNFSLALHVTAHGLHEEFLSLDTPNLTKTHTLQVWKEWLRDEKEEAMNWSYQNLNHNDKAVQQVLLQRGDMEAVTKLLDHSDFKNRTESWEYIANSVQYRRIENYKLANAQSIIKQLERDYIFLPKEAQFYRRISNLIFSSYNRQKAKDLINTISNTELKEQLSEVALSTEVELDFL